MSHHIFYIDDSGTKEYAARQEDYSTSGNTPYFCFGGVLVEANAGAKLGEIIGACKAGFFGTDAVELKSNWLRIPKERKSRYLDHYGKNDSELNTFVDTVYELLADSDLMLIASIVDKVQMQADYGEQAFYPPAFAYEVLLQRIVQTITPPDTVSVVIDDMDGATPKGRQYKINLKRQHQTLRQHGSRLQTGLNWEPLQGVRFVDSAKSHHIQVADIVAYNVYRQFILHGEDWDNPGQENMSTYPWFERLAHKFRNDDGRIQGYGIVKLPMRERVRWGIKK